MCEHKSEPWNRWLVHAKAWKRRGLSTRAAYVLAENGITTEEQLRRCSYSDLMGLCNFGIKCVREIEAFTGADLVPEKPGKYGRMVASSGSMSWVG